VLYNSANRFVLAVDDGPQSLISLSMITQRPGYHACSALGVGNALEIASASALCLVIAELHLKGLSGLDLLERLRQSRKRLPSPSSS
jgi:DNA-binding response OmpR family regulator